MYEFLSAEKRLTLTEQSVPNQLGTIQCTLIPYCGDTQLLTSVPARRACPDWLELLWGFS